MANNLLVRLSTVELLFTKKTCCLVTSLRHSSKSYQIDPIVVLVITKKDIVGCQASYNKPDYCVNSLFKYACCKTTQPLVDQACQKLCLLTRQLRDSVKEEWQKASIYGALQQNQMDQLPCMCCLIFFITTPAYHLGRYSLHIRQLKSSMVDHI